MISMVAHPNRNDYILIRWKEMMRMAFTADVACKQSVFGADDKVCASDSEGKFKNYPWLENFPSSHE